MKPRVSVCMIAYNHEVYIRQAIESILSQDVDFPIELVIGDDCSPDGTAAICEEFARRDPRVRLLSRERNLGVMPPSYLSRRVVWVMRRVCRLPKARHP